MGPGKNRNSPNNTSSNQATTRGSWGEKGKKKSTLSNQSLLLTADSEA